jgi:hypothetical protein
MDASEYQVLAEVAVDAVRPDSQGFAMTGRSLDGSEYRVGLKFEVPLDARTRVALGEMLTQATLSIARKPPPAETRAGSRTRRDGAHHR